MDAAKTLIRTVVRTFYSTKHVLVIDSLFVHHVLHAEDLAILLSSQPKDVRRFVQPLRTARILHTHSRSEARVGSVRGVTREYYYIPYHVAIDAIKFRVMMLTKRVKELYKQDSVRKDWRCPVCKAEWDELQVLDKMGSDGFECHRCGNVLIRIERSSEADGNHEKIKRLNIQLKRLQEMIEDVDQQKIPENRFEEAEVNKKDVPRDRHGQVGPQFVVLKKDQGVKKTATHQTDASALNIHLTSGAEQEAEEEARKGQIKAELAKQNQLPSWITNSLTSQYHGASTSEDPAVANGVTVQKDEIEEEKKPDLVMQDELDAYLAEMRREKEEAAMKAAEEDAESEDEEDDFEDVISTAAITPIPGTGTPSSSQQAIVNGLKRELETDSGVSSDTNTPAGTPFGRESKRTKLENGDHKPAVLAEDTDDEEDFEDAM